jgi:hypothetical protein
MKKMQALLFVIAFSAVTTPLFAQKTDKLNVKTWVINNPQAILISEIVFKKKPLPEQAILLLNPRVIVYKTAVVEQDIKDYEFRNL